MIAKPRLSNAFVFTYTMSISISILSLSRIFTLMSSPQPPPPRLVINDHPPPPFVPSFRGPPPLPAACTDASISLIQAFQSILLVFHVSPFQERHTLLPIQLWRSSDSCAASARIMASLTWNGMLRSLPLLGTSATALMRLCPNWDVESWHT